jgi:hypothetical protein
MDLKNYILQNFNGKDDWFVEEVESWYHQKRIQKILDIKDYLGNNKHKILNRTSEMWNGKEYHPKAIRINYAKTLLDFECSYLLKNPITLAGEEEIVKKFKEVYRKGKYNSIDFDILFDIVRYGVAIEYIYIDGNNIKSKLIDPADAYPVYDDQNNYIAFIESFTINGITYYTLFENDKVIQYDNNGGQLHLTGEYVNYCGLPIVYISKNEANELGGSHLEDYIDILDSLEELISKYFDSFYKHHNPIACAIGQQLKGNGLPSNIVGGGIALDDNADFKMVTTNLDYKSFEGLFKTLKQALIDVAMVPAVSMNSQDVSNLSEVSIKLLFSLADIRAGMNERVMREGIEERFERIAKLIYADTIPEVVFAYARPQNEKDIIDNIVALKNINALSLRTLTEQNPLVNDVDVELGRIKDYECECENKCEI